jgi:hypothetical protein
MIALRNLGGLLGKEKSGYTMVLASVIANGVSTGRMQRSGNPSSAFPNKYPPNQISTEIIFPLLQSRRLVMKTRV